MNKELIKSIQDKHIELHYNEKKIRINNQNIKIEMKGKINCPVLNDKISSLTCSKLMDQKDWPRNIDHEICDKANCKIYKSIQKNMEVKKYEKHNTTTKHNKTD